jgi:hypothetical protein
MYSMAQFNVIRDQFVLRFVSVDVNMAYILLVLPRFNSVNEGGILRVLRNRN